MLTLKLQFLCKEGQFPYNTQKYLQKQNDVNKIYIYLIVSAQSVYVCVCVQTNILQLETKSERYNIYKIDRQLYKISEKHKSTVTYYLTILYSKIIFCT